MRVIGGFVTPSGGIVFPSIVKQVARRRSGATVWAEHGPVGLFATLGPEAMESTDDLWVVADLALTNVPELHDVTGLRAGQPGVLAALYALDGPHFVRRLRGGFAVAAWDRQRQTLLLAVDHFGIKRLYFVEGPDGFAFASRPSILAAGHEADLGSVYQYLNFGFVPTPASVFVGVRRLAPGHLLLVRGGSVTLHSYWDL